jgi:hypothetical protein
MIDQLRALNIAEIEMSRGEFMLMNYPGDELFRQSEPSWIAPVFAASPITVRPSKTIKISRMRFVSRRFWERKISVAMPQGAF